jgi:hypothetical protein
MTDSPSPPSAEEQCWDYIVEMLGMVRLSCDVAQTYCDMRDRHGLNYQFRRMIPHIRAATQTFKELENMLVTAELMEENIELTQQRGRGAAADREPAKNAGRDPRNQR